MQDHSNHIPLQEISDEITGRSGVKLYMLRADLNHPQISGNKLFKLKYNLEEARRSGKDSILTFGGAFSNHIAATAAAGKEYGFRTIGIIRGDETEELNPTLRFAKEQGMQLYFVNREHYKQKENPGFLNTVLPDFLYDPINLYTIPEGAANIAGIKGCSEIINHISIPFDRICCPCGTGTTLAGIILSLKEGQEATGFQVLKGEGYMKAEVQRWLNEFQFSAGNWNINEDYHFGGYAKVKPELLHFIEQFEKSHNIPLDFIYTGKMMYGIYDLLQKGFFKNKETIVAVHTGGLQGNSGFANLILK